MSLASSAKEAIVISSVAAGVMLSGPSLVKAGEIIDHHSFSSSPIDKSHTFRYGHTGHTVTKIQEKLAKMMLYQGNIDGIFGKKTENAVKQFQQLHHLKADGMIDEKTFSKLVAVTPANNIKFGDQNEQVSAFQTKLKALNYYAGSVDGIFGRLTFASVKEYQKKNNLEVTGKLDASTQLHISTNRNKKGKTLQSVKIKTVHNTEVQNSVTSIAKSFVGTNYVWGGTTPAGFDCSGFIQYVFDQANVLIPRTTNEMWNFAKPVQKAGIGDVVFFETYKPGPSHAGIYLGNGEFIHTSSSKGVTISHLTDPYWKDRYLGAKKIPIQ
ncbi:MAG TPA: peptidoglycan-binding protein [Metabacillus sp.]|nr:peptidoglycan-binding protein [Metabacillus sp.]